MIDPVHGWNVSFKPVIIGFILSILLVLAAYFIVIEHALVGWNLTFLIIGIGTLQALLQFVFFLHLGIEAKPRWGLMIFLFMVLVTLVIVLGSLWIMHNLDYHIMPTKGY